MFWGSLNEISRVVREVPIGEIEIPEGRIRRREGDLQAEEALRSLAESIRRHGVVEPLGRVEFTYCAAAPASPKGAVAHIRPDHLRLDRRAVGQPRQQPAGL